MKLSITSARREFNWEENPRFVMHRELLANFRLHMEAIEIALPVNMVECTHVTYMEFHHALQQGQRLYMSTQTAPDLRWSRLRQQLEHLLPSPPSPKASSVGLAGH